MEFYTRSDSQQFSFFRIPKLLFRDARYKKISTDAKLLYGLMLDRLELSQQNGWYDESGHAYIYFRREDIEDQLSVGHTYAAALLKELESVDLISRKRQGLGMPMRVYIGRFTPSAAADVHSSVSRTIDADSRNADGQTTVSRTSDVRDTDDIYMMNNTEKNDTEYQSSATADDITTGADAPVDVAGWTEHLNQLLSIPELISERPDQEQQIFELVRVAAIACASTRKWQTVASTKTRTSDIRAELQRLTKAHIAYVLDCLPSSRPSVKNISQYLLAALYNSRSTMYTSQLLKASSDADRNAWMDEYV